MATTTRILYRRGRANVLGGAGGCQHDRESGERAEPSHGIHDSGGAAENQIGGRPWRLTFAPISIELM
jgi:hypothetical protein